MAALVATLSLMVGLSLRDKLKHTSKYLNPPQPLCIKTKLLFPDFSATSDLLLCLGCCHQDVLDPLVLPPFRHRSLVSMGAGAGMGRCDALFHRRRRCRDIGV